MLKFFTKHFLISLFLSIQLIYIVFLLDGWPWSSFTMFTQHTNLTLPVYEIVFFRKNHQLARIRDFSLVSQRIYSNPNLKENAVQAYVSQQWREIYRHRAQTADRASIISSSISIEGHLSQQKLLFSFSLLESY